MKENLKVFDLRKLVLFFSLFSIVFLFSGCDWFDNNGEEKSKPKQSVSQEQGKSSVWDSSEFMSFEEAYSQLVGPVWDSFQKSVEKAKQLETTREDFELSASGDVQNFKWNLNLIVSWKFKNSFEDMNEVEWGSDIKLEWNVNFMNPSTQKQQNVWISTDAEVRVVAGKVFALLKELNIDTQDTQIKMLLSMVSGFKWQWIQLANLSEMSNSNMTMNTKEVYDFMDKLTSLLEENPLFEKTGKKQESGKLIYDVKLSQKNIGVLYESIMTHDFMDNVIRNSIKTNWEDISKEEFIKKGSQALKNALENVDCKWSLIVDSQNNISLEIDKIKVVDQPGQIKLTINKQWDDVDWNIVFSDSSSQQKANLSFDNKQDKFNFVLEVFQSNVNKLFELAGDMKINYLDNWMDSNINLQLNWSFGNVNVNMTDKVRGIAGVEVQEPKDYQKIQEIMNWMMWGWARMPGGWQWIPQQIPEQQIQPNK